MLQNHKMVSLYYHTWYLIEEQLRAGEQQYTGGRGRQIETKDSHLVKGNPTRSVLEHKRRLPREASVCPVILVVLILILLLAIMLNGGIYT